MDRWEVFHSLPAHSLKSQTKMIKNDTPLKKSNLQIKCPKFKMPNIFPNYMILAQCSLSKARYSQVKSVNPKSSPILGLDLSEFLF